MFDWRLSDNLGNLYSFHVQADATRIAVEMYSSYTKQEAFTENGDVVSSL